MSDYPIHPDDLLRPAIRVTTPLLLDDNDVTEHHFDWDSADLVAPGGLSPARQLAMQRQQERLSSMPRARATNDR